MHVLVTGASSGIGAGLAKAFGAAGYDLTLVARRAAEMERIADSIGRQVKIEIIPCDLSDLAGIPDLVARAEAANGPIDVLINNAGVQIIDATMAHDAEAGERMVTLNLFAPLRLTRAVYPSMKKRHSGTIVDIASVAAFSHTTYMTYYNASKAALAAASISLRAELKADGIHVMTVYPGPVRTPMGDNGAARFEKEPTIGPLPMPWGTPEELGQLILAGIRNQQAEIVYPAFYKSAKVFRGISQALTTAMTPKLKQS
jgi:short-subunit dehydrogenase